MYFTLEGRLNVIIAFKDDDVYVMMICEHLYRYYYYLIFINFHVTFLA